MNKGFTIIELIAVIAILGLLAVIVTPTYDTVSSNIRKRNYESRKSEIKAQVLYFVENYAKDKVYDGSGTTKYLCFTPDFLIKNGIITSDDNKDEYIKNDYTGEEYRGDDKYIKVFYEISNRKLYAITKDETLATIQANYTIPEDEAKKHAFDSYSTSCSKQDDAIFE